MFRCDLTFGLPQSESRDLRRDRFRQFQVATRFDTIWARFGHEYSGVCGPEKFLPRDTLRCRFGAHPFVVVLKAPNAFRQNPELTF
jgi:hypothetical protein